MSDLPDISRLLRALAVEMRLRILRSVAQRALCVGALAVQLGITQGAVSQHLRILRDAGLVRAERRGMFIHYQANPEGLQRCHAALRELLAPAPARGHRTRQHQGGSSCPRRSAPVGSRKR